MGELQFWHFKIHPFIRPQPQRELYQIPCHRPRFLTNESYKCEKKGKNCRRANDERINKLNATGCLSHRRNYARRMGSLKELTIYLCLLLRYVSYWCLENRCYYKRVKSSITCTWRFQRPLSFFSRYMCSSCKLVVRNRKCSGLQEHFVENSERDQTQCQLVKQPQLNGN